MIAQEMEVEEVVEKINTKLMEIQMRYPGKDLAEALAMTLLAISFERETERKNYPDQEELTNDFDQVDELLEKLLN